MTQHPSESNAGAWSTSSASSSSSSENPQRPEDIAAQDSLLLCVSSGTGSMMGRRREMEDTVRVELEFAKTETGSRTFDYFGLFDGHGGAQVAEACRDRMHQIVESEISNGDATDWEGIMVRSFEAMDCEVTGLSEESTAGEKRTVGSTAVVAVFGADELVIANCGDSRAVICRNGTAVPLSVDHKPNRADELARIEAAGGRVINWQGFRVLGVLATSRSIGDEYLKPFVIPKPEVTICRRTEDDEFLILGSDGLWDVVTNETACQLVSLCMEGRIETVPVDGSNRSAMAASLLMEFAIVRGSRDNISAVVVQLKKAVKAVRLPPATTEIAADGDLM